VSHTWLWRQIGGRGPVGSVSPSVLVLPVVVVWNTMLEVGIFVLHWMCEVGKGEGTCCHSCNSMQCWLLVVVVALGARHHPGLDGIDWK